MLKLIRHYVLAVIDFIHRPFARWIDTQTFRYLACGGSNQVLYIALYWINYNLVLHRAPLVFGGFSITGHTAAIVLSQVVSIPLGFILSRYIVFPGSELHGAVQFFRYLMLIALCFVLTVIMVKFFVEYCGFYPTGSSALTSIILAVFSFLVQRSFTFKSKTEKVNIEDLVP